MALKHNSWKYPKTWICEGVGCSWKLLWEAEAWLPRRKLGYEHWWGWMVWKLNVENHVDAALLVLKVKPLEWLSKGMETQRTIKIAISNWYLGGRFKHFFCSFLCGEMEMIQFEKKMQMGWFNHQLGIDLNLEVANFHILSASSPRDGPWRYSGVVVLVGLLWGKTNVKKCEKIISPLERALLRIWKEWVSL